jgi:hypothetical protein
MATDSIDRVLAAKRESTQPAAAAEADRFYSAPLGEGLQEHFLELRMRDGLQICLSYTDLAWFSYDPDGPKIDLEFGGIFVTIKGRGIGDALFNKIKQKRVAWIKEPDTEMQDHPGNAVFIEEITFLTKQDEAGQQEEAAKAE